MSGIQNTLLGCSGCFCLHCFRKGPCELSLEVKMTAWQGSPERALPAFDFGCSRHYFLCHFLLLQMHFQQWSDFSFFFDPWPRRLLCPNPAAGWVSPHCLIAPHSSPPNLTHQLPLVPASSPPTLRTALSISWPGCTVHCGISSPLGFRKPPNLRWGISAQLPLWFPFLIVHNVFLCFLLVSPDCWLEYFHNFASLTI